MASPTFSDSPSTSTTAVQSIDVKEYGDHPPTYLDALKDLTQSSMPPRVLTFDLQDSTDDFLSTMSVYRDTALFTTITVFLSKEDRLGYAERIEDMGNAAFVGRAVCGNPSTAPDQKVCVMAGNVQTLEVGSLSEKLTLADVGAFTEALYDAL